MDAGKVSVDIGRSRCQVMATGRSLVANILSSHQEEVGRGAEFVDRLLTGKQRDVAVPVRVTKYL